MPRERVAQPRLLVRLSHRRVWRWSVVLAAAAFAMQTTALVFVPLILVQAVLVTGLLWYVLLAALERHRPDGPILLEALLCLFGLTAFLVIAAPSADPSRGLDSIRAGIPLAGRRARRHRRRLSRARRPACTPGGVRCRWRSRPAPVTASRPA